MRRVNGMRNERRCERGVTLAELVVAMALLGLVMTVAIPRLYVSAERRVEIAASQLVRDLDLARTKAIASRKAVRLVFDGSAGSYKAFADHDRDGTISEIQLEADEVQGLGRTAIEKFTKFGRGSSIPFPGDAGSGGITLPSEKLEFDSRGMTVPFGTGGLLYLQHESHPEIVALVTGSLKRTVGCTSTLTSLAPSRGVVAETVGATAASTVNTAGE